MCPELLFLPVLGTSSGTLDTIFGQISGTLGTVGPISDTFIKQLVTA